MKKRFTQSDFFLKKIHPRLSFFPGYDYWLLRKKSYLWKNGWFRSFRTGTSVDSEGNPLPWLTYGAIELLVERLPAGLTVFEYGCGHGTQWWALKSERVDAVEHEKQWVDKISNKMPSHVHILHRELGDLYEAAVTESGILYDVIIIDGRNRVKCCEESAPHLSGRGIIIFDDTHRAKYNNGIYFLKKQGFKQLPLRGFSPIEFMECETSIFYRDGNLLDL